MMEAAQAGQRSDGKRIAAVVVVIDAAPAAENRRVRRQRGVRPSSSSSSSTEWPGGGADGRSGGERRGCGRWRRIGSGGGVKGGVVTSGFALDDVVVELVFGKDLAVDLHVLPEGRRVRVGLVAAAHFAVVRLVGSVDVRMLLAIGRVGEAAIASVEFTFERFFSWRRRKRRND